MELKKHSKNETTILEVNEIKDISPSKNEFISSLGHDVKVGLTNIKVDEERTKCGYNELAKSKKNGFWHILKEQFKDLLNVMLLFIAVIDFAATPLLGDAATEHVIQGLVILIIVVVNIGLSIFQEIKAGKALDALEKTASPTAKVLREGRQQIISTRDLVLGDIVFLEEGCIIPADLRLIETNALKIEEAALTGESLPVEKNADKDIDVKVALGDRVNYAFASTVVTYGSGIGVVTAIGMGTEIGKIATLLNSSEDKKTLPPLKRKINKLTKTLTIFAFSLLAIMIILNVVFYFTHFASSFGPNPHNDYKFWVNLDTIINCLALAISLIPVALPVTTTVVLSMSVSKMAKKNALCKNLTIVETIGNVDVVCSDKTGTLTLNKMTVVSINDYEDIINKHDKSVEEIKMNLPRYKHIVSIGMFCNNAEMDTNNPDNFFGDPTEAALLVLGNKTELSVEKTRNKYKRVYEQPFDSDRKRMTTVYKTKHGYTSFTKGAAESIIELCTHIDTDNGPREITNEDKKLIKDYLNYLSSKALRVLGFASTNFIDAPTKDSNYEQAMTFKGLVGMIDPPREEVYDAVKTCHEAGVQVSMITGDHQITALAIAHQLGIVPLDDQTTMTGVEIDALSDEFLREKVKGCHVYARVSPDNKLRIVQAYKDNGMIAAMTGDGTNDAPALKTADIGIAMGKTGTDVAKGAASILLLDDNFTTIKTAINDGRKITRNIRNVISFILSTNLGTALFIFLFTYLFTLNPLIVTQRLLLDLVTDTMPCIFIGLNPNDFGLMRVKQRKTDKLFDKTMFREIFINTMAIFISTTIVFLTAYLAIGFGGIGNPKDGVKFKALDCLCFITLSLSRILLSLSYISKSKSIFSKEGRPYSGMYVAISISIVLLFLFTFIPGLNKIVETPSSSEWTGNELIWILVFTMPLLTLFSGELEKIIVRHKIKKVEKATNNIQVVA